MRPPHTHPWGGMAWRCRARRAVPLHSRNDWFHTHCACAKDTLVGAHGCASPQPCVRTHPPLGGMARRCRGTARRALLAVRRHNHSSAHTHPWGECHSKRVCVVRVVPARGTLRGTPARRFQTRRPPRRLRQQAGTSSFSSVHLRFNKHPPLGVNATLPYRVQGGRATASFNGHPPLGVNIIPTALPKFVNAQDSNPPSPRPSPSLTRGERARSGGDSARAGMCEL